mgnify:CR=1 FL=1
MSPFKKLSMVTAIVLVTLSFPVAASWSVHEDASQVNFVSVKKNTIGESHTLNGISGTISNEGQVYISIDLNSVETLIPVRNERLKALFFETEKFPQAIATAQLDLVEIKALSHGQLIKQEVVVTVDLHGVKADIPMHVQITMLANNQLWVAMTEPVVINITDFDLLGGLEALTTIAKLSSISAAVPVTCQLLFNVQ